VLVFLTVAVCRQCNYRRGYNTIYNCSGLPTRSLPSHLGHWSWSRQIVIVIWKFLKRYPKAKRTRATAYSRALRRIKGGFPKGGQEKLRFDFQSTRNFRMGQRSR